ncbi:MAG: UbiA prenyltransferase family protein [Candidatus Altiarchaeota archaeon]
MQRYLQMLRAHQWYKNLVIFLALFFTKNIFNHVLLYKTFLGFISLCFISSAYYILNDIKDRDADKKHPEKKTRPIASGRVSVSEGYAVSGLLFISSCVIGYNLSIPFMVFPVILFISSNAYNLGLKDIPFVDVHVIAVNFLIRAVSGAVLINVPTSPWLIMTVFFLALLLGISKRRSELSLLGDDAVKFKRVYEYYTQPLLDMFLVVVSSILLFAYSLYTFQVHNSGYMMLTIPFASFIVFRYLYFASVNHRIARKTQYMFQDKQILIGFLLWILASFYVLYVIG